MLDYSYRWGYMVLKIDTKVNLEQRLDLAREALFMYCNEITWKKIKNDHCEGKIYTKHEHAVIGMFSGPVFYADVDTDNGLAKLSFIIDEKGRYDGVSESVN